MQNRQKHQQEVLTFLQKHVSPQTWEFSLPHGWGNETYFARSREKHCFIKLGIQIERYRVMASIGLTPPLLTAGQLVDGTSIIVQDAIDGRMPSRKDYRDHLEQFATAIKTFHQSPELQRSLPPVPSGSYNILAYQALEQLRRKWQVHRALVPSVAGFIDESLDELGRQVHKFQGQGAVASHNDINQGNWLLSADDRLYLLDLESMSLDDPALDMGATLWWYYPPGLRGRFLKLAGYPDDAEFKRRMQLRMSMHCLNILLPREGSFDEFDSCSFPESLVDFRASLAGEENPQGYGD
jgi:hypothetical protein